MSEKNITDSASAPMIDTQPTIPSCSSYYGQVLTEPKEEVKEDKNENPWQVVQRKKKKNKFSNCTE